MVGRDHLTMYLLPVRKLHIPIDNVIPRPKKEQSLWNDVQL
jgi:hypothetical protein